MNSQALIREVGNEWIELMLKKNTDYGDTVFQTPCLCPNLPVESAILTRMSDKIDRLKNLSKGNKALVEESFDDTVADLGAYCLLFLVNKRMQKRKSSSVDFEQAIQPNTIF